MCLTCVTSPKIITHPKRRLIRGNMTNAVAAENCFEFAYMYLEKQKAIIV